MTPQMAMGGVPGPDHPDIHMQAYGYGWMMGSYKGHYRVEHGGNINGFSANVAFYPSDSIGIVVLTNQSGSSIPSAFSERIRRSKKGDRILVDKIRAVGPDGKQRNLKPILIELK